MPHGHTRSLSTTRETPESVFTKGHEELYPAGPLPLTSQGGIAAPQAWKSEEPCSNSNLATVSVDLNVIIPLELVINTWKGSLCADHTKQVFEITLIKY